MQEKITSLIKKFVNRETIAYLIVGMCTSVVSIGTYWLYTRVFGITNEHVAKFLSMFAAMAFAFYPNKVWVFQSRGKSGRELIHEIWTFFTTRAFAVALEQGLFFALVEFTPMHDMIANAISMAVIVVVNYLFAKFFIFKKNREA